MWWMGWGYFAGIFTLLFYVGIASQAALFFVEAKRSGLLELLLATPLTSAQVAQGQWRALVRMFGLPMNLAASQFLDDSVRTGRPAVARVAPGGIFGYLREHPEEARVFQEAMTAKAHGQIASILAAVDFSAFPTIADVGGGRGHLLRAVLHSAPKAKGVLFDLPDVLRDLGTAASERLRLQAGDFFNDRLPQSDAYLLMDIIHDWADEPAAAILAAVRAAAPPNAKLFLIESIVPDEPGPHWAKTLDIVMLAVTGGLQRSVREYDLLLTSAGFRLERVIDTPATVSIVQAVPS